MLLAGCKDKKNMDNPFFSKWDTPYEIPDFSRIKTEHYMPAFMEGMKQQKEQTAPDVGACDDNRCGG